MTIREEINRQVKHIEQMIINIQAHSSTKTKETINNSYWCGRQIASTTIDFIDTLKSMNIISDAEYTEFTQRIRKIYHILCNTYNSLNL